MCTAKILKISHQDTTFFGNVWQAQWILFDTKISDPSYAMICTSKTAWRALSLKKAFSTLYSTWPGEFKFVDRPNKIFHTWTKLYLRESALLLIGNQFEFIKLLKSWWTWWRYINIVFIYLDIDCHLNLGIGMVNRVQMQKNWEQWYWNSTEVAHRTKYL